MAAGFVQSWGMTSFLLFETKHRMARTHARIISLPFGYSGGVQRPYVRFQTEQDKIAILKAGSLVRRKNELHLKFLLMKTLGLLTAGCSG